MRKSIYLPLLFVLAACGSDDNMGFSDTFNASDTVTTSIFSQTDADQQLADRNFFLKVVSTGVSSGFVTLNESDLYTPSSFRNTSFEQTFSVDLQDENTLEVEIRGQPGDQLCIQVYEEFDDPEEEDQIIYERCVDREAGPPNSVSVVIGPDDEESE